jgi:hypothetical protein
MKNTNIDIEKEIITGCIVSTQFLREIKPILKPQSLTLSYAKYVAHWCFEYFDVYEKAPEKHIKDLYYKNSGKIHDQAEAKLIQKFLVHLSDNIKDLETFNVEFALDRAVSYLRLRSLEYLKENIDECLLQKNPDEGEQLVSEYSRLTRTKTGGINPIGDIDYITQAFTEDTKDILFKMPGVLGDLTGPFERGFLFALVANQKFGKSWWLQQIALEALFNNLNVLFISFEMSEKWMIRRIHQTLSAKPYLKKHVGDVLIPEFDCALNQNNTCKRKNRVCSVGLLEKNAPPTVKQQIQGDLNKVIMHPKPDKNYKCCSYCINKPWYQMEIWYKVKKKKALNLGDVKRQGLSLTKYGLKGKQLKFIQMPDGTPKSEVQTYINNLVYYENFKPDVFVFDYLDKINADDTRKKWLQQETEVWSWAKALAQKYYALVATANQGNTIREGKDLKIGNWAGSINKAGLVDIAWFGNQKPKEKRDGYCRMFTFNRHDEFDLTTDITVLQCLKLGKPYLDSYYLRKY